MTTSDNASVELDAVIAAAAKTRFIPLAYYDKHLDCIRIELQDCSIVEERISVRFTILYDAHAEEGDNPVVGLTIKGIRHFFGEKGWPLEGVQRVTRVLDKAVKAAWNKLDNLDNEPKDVQTVIAVADVLRLDVNFSDQDVDYEPSCALTVK